MVLETKAHGKCEKASYVSDNFPRLSSRKFTSKLPLFVLGIGDVSNVICVVVSF